MVSFTRRLAAAWTVATGPALPLALVPLVSSLLQFEKFQRVLGFHGGHVGVNFRFPAAVADLWTLVSLPNQGGGVHVTGPLLLLPVLVVVQAALAAGYLGSIRSMLAGDRYAFADCVGRYFLPFLGYSALTFGLGLVSVGFAAAGGRGAAALVLVVGLPAHLLLAYLFYATPYLVVVRDSGLLDALAESYRLALAGGPYAAFAGGYLVATAGISLVATAVVVNLGPVGLLLGLVGGPLVGLTLTVATMQFVLDLVADD